MRRSFATVLILAIGTTSVSGCVRSSRTGVRVESASRVVFTIPKRFRAGNCRVSASILHGARYTGKDLGQVWTLKRPDGIATPCPAKIVFPDGLPGYSTAGATAPLPPGDYAIYIDGVGALLTNGFTIPK